MSVVRTHHYTVEPADLTEFLRRREAVIATVRNRNPGPTQTVLTRLEDGTFADSWRWDSAEQMQAALANMPMAEAGAAFSLTHDATRQDGEIIDQH